MEIQVLGSGCPTCKKLYELTKQAVEELKLDTKVEYITDIQKMIELGVMSSPVLAIDGKPISVGTVPSLEKIKGLINSKDDTKEDANSEGSCSCGRKC